MGELRHETLKRRVGEEMVHRFEGKLHDDLFSKENELKKLEESANLTMEMPFATAPFVHRGFMRTRNEMASQLHVFQPNIWGQDFAHEIGSLSKMTIGSSYERGLSTAEMKIKSPSVRSAIKRSGKLEYEYAETIIEMALIESGYISRLSGLRMPEEIARKYDVAIMKRSLKNEYVFRTVAESIDFDLSDPVALLQINKTIDLTSYLQEIAEKDPYFNRRNPHICEHRRINTEASAAWEKSLIGDDFLISLLQHLTKRKSVDPHLVSVLERQIRGEQFKRY
jgi:hypothetical protein